MAQPLKENFPAFCLQLFGTDNKFTSKDVIKRWDFIEKELLKYEIRIMGRSSDGDARLLKSMKDTTELGKHHATETYFGQKVWYSSNNNSIDAVQDSTHIGTKLRNRLLKASIYLPFGEYIISKSHLTYLVENVSKDQHGLTESDVDPKDRQNFRSFQKISSENVCKALKKHVPDSDGTIMYLTLCREITSSYMDSSLEPLDRIDKIWYSLFILRAWRLWIVNSDHTLGNNFLTSNAYNCIELNAHNLINSIIKFKSSEINELFIPPLFSSQHCESFFRQIR